VRLRDAVRLRAAYKRAPINARLLARMPALVDTCLALLDDWERLWRAALKRSVHPALKMQ